MADRHPGAWEQRGRPADWNATCSGDAADNAFYGEGIVDAAAAVN